MIFEVTKYFPKYLGVPIINLSDFPIIDLSASIIDLLEGR